MWTLLAVALSGCAYYVSIGLGEFWSAAWIAPIPVLLVVFRSSWRTPRSPPSPRTSSAA